MIGKLISERKRNGQLPRTLTLEDYAGTEKNSGLPKRLSTKDAPSGSDPSVGDITF
jgi:hypothetical protein